jgi:hypothetical protein
MPRLIWLVLRNGASLLASCDSAAPERLKEAIEEKVGALILTADDRVERLPAAEVTDFCIVEAPAQFPRSARVYRFLHV